MVKGHTTGVVLLIITMVNDMKHKSDHDVKLSFLLFTWSKSDIRVAFERQWSKFVPAILQYGENSQKKGLQSRMLTMIEAGM